MLPNCIGIFLTFLICKTGFYLFTRVIAVTFCVTLAASLAARLGATPMAAFQICLQVWLASSLLADGLAVAGQVKSTRNKFPSCVKYALISSNFASAS